MKRMARDLLKKLGAEKADRLGWRDMWAMVAKKGERSYGELFSKSSGFNSWGSAVQLKVEVPLVPIDGKSYLFSLDSICFALSSLPTL